MLHTRNDVLTFMTAGDQLEKGYGKQSDLYMNLITEEVIHELLKEIDNKNIVGIADGIADSIWVIEGLAITLGVDLEKIWDQINKSSDGFDVTENKEFEVVNMLLDSYISFRYCYHDGQPGIENCVSWILECLVDLSTFYGLPLQDVWDEVNRSNSSKISDNGKILKNAQGKIQKPDAFSPADIESVLKYHNII